MSGESRDQRRRRVTAILYQVARRADALLAASGDPAAVDVAEVSLRRVLRDLDGADPGWLAVAQRTSPTPNRRR